MVADMVGTESERITVVVTVLIRIVVHVVWRHIVTGRELKTEVKQPEVEQLKLVSRTYYFTLVWMMTLLRLLAMATEVPACSSQCGEGLHLCCCFLSLSQFLWRSHRHNHLHQNVCLYLGYAGLPISDTHTKNHFPRKSEGLRQFRDHH